MSQSRHRAAAPALRTRVGKLVVPAALATVLTGLVVGVGTVASGHSKSVNFAAEKAAVSLTISDLSDLSEIPEISERTQQPSRTARRVVLEPEAVGRKFATADLNIWLKATDKSKNVGLVDSGDRVAVTGKVVNGWAEVLLKGQVRYVNAKYLSAKKPTGGVVATSGISLAPCPDGSSTENGLTPAAVRLFRAACAAFPALSRYGGWDNHGEHSSGKAIDFMISDPALGKALAEWLRAHAAELNLYNVIWAQQIYTQERGGEGWRFMSNRGSATANHYDHVHSSVN